MTSKTPAEQIKDIEMLELAICLVGNLLRLGEPAVAKVAPAESKAYNVAVKAVAIAGNSANKFLEDYKANIGSPHPTWPPVSFTPPHIVINQTTLQAVIASIENIISEITLAFQGKPHGGEAADALSNLKDALVAIMKLIAKAYPGLLNQTVSPTIYMEAA